MDKGETMRKVSLVLSSYKRPELLDIGLASILRNKPDFDFEIIVVNDGIHDNTAKVCQKYSRVLNMKYIFSGHRNLDGVMKHRVSGFALNIGIQQATGDIVVLSCPEIYHINKALQITVDGLVKNPDTMSVPELMYFDQDKAMTDILLGCGEEKIDYSLLSQDDEYNRAHIQMPYLMGIYKHHIMEMGGFDEDFTGYAGEDNDFVDRLKLKGLKHLRTDARIIHLYHGGTGDGYAHHENPAWVHNWNLLQSRKGILKRNEGRKWGKVDG